MENQDWHGIVDALVDAKRYLATAWRILDGTGGAASGLQPALTSIDANRAHARPQRHVASRAAVREYWEEHGELSGFAIGT
jgi:shikimate 5-dehydrogenase